MLRFRNVRALVTCRHWACASVGRGIMAVPWSLCWRSSAGAAVVLDWCCGISRRAFTHTASAGRGTASSSAVTQVTRSRCWWWWWWRSPAWADEWQITALHDHISFEMRMSANVWSCNSVKGLRSDECWRVCAELLELCVKGHELMH